LNWQSGHDGREAIGPALLGFVEENIDQADARFGHRAGQAAAATFGLQRVVDDVAPSASTSRSMVVGLYWSSNVA
jgi:hypothetical protein